MIVCFCTNKTEDDVKRIITKHMQDGDHITKDKLREIHAALNETDGPMGRCYSCIDEVEEWMQIYVERGYKF